MSNTTLTNTDSLLFPSIEPNNEHDGVPGENGLSWKEVNSFSLLFFCSLNHFIYMEENQFA